MALARLGKLRHIIELVIADGCETPDLAVSLVSGIICVVLMKKQMYKLYCMPMMQYCKAMNE